MFHSVVIKQLFNIFINEIPQEQTINLSLNADDTSLFTKSWYNTITYRLTKNLRKIHQHLTNGI